MARRRKKHQDYKNLEITFVKTGEKKQVKLIGESASGKSMHVIFDDNQVGYIQKKNIENAIEL